MRTLLLSRGVEDGVPAEQEIGEIRECFKQLEHSAEFIDITEDAVPGTGFLIVHDPVSSETDYLLSMAEEIGLKHVEIILLLSPSHLDLCPRRSNEALPYLMTDELPVYSMA